MTHLPGILKQPRRNAIALWILLAACLSISRAQSPSRGMNSLYVEAFTGGPEAATMRDSFIRHLPRDRFHIVPSRSEADAVVRATGRVWLRGRITINTRTPAADRQAVYAGYLSVEMLDASGQPLWSWLVTPGRLVWNNVVDDLASHAAKKLAEAVGSGAFAAAPATHALAAASLSAGGATFPAPLYQKWFEDFHDSHAGVQIHYAPIGSQRGAEQLAAGKLDFAGSDIPPEEILGASAAARIQKVATVLGAVVPIYNLPGSLRDLRFTAAILADIYSGKITRWNDPAMRRCNPGIDLPDTAITVVHRSDGSGTTWVWSEYLTETSPAFASSIGRGTTLHWPTGIGAEGNAGVAREVTQRPNSIGYVELTYAIQNMLTFGSVQNRAGEFIHASLESVAAAARSLDPTQSMPSSLINAPGKNAYPIVSFTWILFPTDRQDAEKQAALSGLLQWMLTSGQRDCASLAYVPLPHALIESQLSRLGIRP